MYALELILTAYRCREVHTAYSNCKQKCTKATLPTNADPSFLEVEEQGKSNCRISDSNDASANNIPLRVYQFVI